MPCRPAFAATSRLAPVLTAAALALLPAAIAGAQPAGAPSPARAGSPAGLLQGEVLDAASMDPLAGATIVLTPVSPTAILPARERSAFLSTARTTVTRADGRYAFADLPPGAYRLRVQRMGYQAAALEVELRGAADARVSVGLTVAPVLLQAMEVRTAAPTARGAAAAHDSAAGDDRIAAARARQAEHLSTDARELTRADVEEAVTLGESDLLRAFQRLPGVTTRDDYSSELWVRGARWDMTRVRFDGLPLFAPFHSSGQYSGLGADAIGGAVLLPGVRSAAHGDAAAAILDLRSRAGGGDGKLRGAGELSLLGAGLTLDQRRRDGRLSWMLGARRSYWDLGSPRLGRPTLFSSEPGYHFSDVVARADLDFGRGRRLELSGLASLDEVVPPDVDSATWSVRRSQQPRSGNRAARATIFLPVGGLATRHDVGVSAFDGRVRAEPPAPACESDFGCWFVSGWPSGLPARSTLRYASLSGEIAPATAAAHPGWRAGYGLTVQRSAFDGFVEGEVFDDSTGLRVSDATSLPVASLWGERRLQPTSRLTVLGGLRLDASRPLANAGALRPMPRLELRWAADSQTALSAALGRSWQYAQALGGWDARTGDRSETTYGTVMRWLVAGDDAPALRTDLLTVGAERWLGAGVLGGASAYARRSAGVRLTGRRPGATTVRRTLVTGAEEAHGLELSLRKLTGRVTGSAGYTLARARTEASGLRFASTQDRTSSVDATAMWRATGRLRLGAAYALATGAPFTRTDPGLVAWDSVRQVMYLETPPSQQAPNAGRARRYESVDLLADWALVRRAVRLDGYLQLRNVLLRDNDAVYRSSGGACSPDIPNCHGGDWFGTGMGVGYLVGLRLRF